MVSQDSLLVTLVKLVDRLQLPALSLKRGRGRPQFYSDRLFLKALVIMIVRRLDRLTPIRLEKSSKSILISNPDEYCTFDLHDCFEKLIRIYSN